MCWPRSITVSPSLLLPLLLLPTLSAPYTPLSDPSILHLFPSPSSPSFSDLDPHTGSLLSPLLVPRIPGTPSWFRVQSHLTAFADAHLPHWTVEWHNTTARTPATGARDVPFRNLILRRDPPGLGKGDVERLTLVAHYDSRPEPKGFVGAIDSAVACAVVLDVARRVEGGIRRMWEEDGEEGEKGWKRVGLQVVLMDGEEDWVKWSDEDSLYGARALASDWATTTYPPGSRFPSPLHSISLFVLLDLLGAPDPRIPSFFPATHQQYQRLADVEMRLRRLDLLESQPTLGAFLPWTSDGQMWAQGGVLDDHVPFLRRGVDILHLIPLPFPSQWHTLDDDADHVDPPTVRDWSRIMSVFVAEWMDLEDWISMAMTKEEEGGAKLREQGSMGSGKGGVVEEQDDSNNHQGEVEGRLRSKDEL